MKTTVGDIQRIIDGEPVEIEHDYPLDDRPGGKWFMRQPLDWEFDMANAVRAAAVAQAKDLPHMKEAAKIPADPDWVERQQAFRAETEEQIEKLRKRKGKLTPEEDLELTNLETRLNNMVDAAQKSSADEIITTTGNRAFEDYLIPLLVVDENGERIFDPDTDIGKARWRAIGRTERFRLRLPMYDALTLVSKAKNLPPGQSSASS